MNDWVDCSSEEFNCTALDSPDTQNLTLRFPRTQVPAQETTYKCMLFDVPQDQDYHVVAIKPYIDNDNVMHHILLYGCGEFDETDAHPSGPYDCNMGAGNGCSDILGVWTLGNPGLCFHDKMGMPIGKNGFKKVALEFHWNNPASESNWTDASGMTLFFTNILRPYNGGMMTIGQNFLEIPPGQPKTIASATCSADCTSAALNTSIHVTAALNHMHYLGSAQSVELRRNGEMVRYITNEPEYSYDNPIFNQFEDEIMIHPNDELITTCQYTSTYSKKWVYYGDATSAEMCFTLIFFYPAEAMQNKFCISWKSIETCATRPVMVNGCNAYAFVSGYDPEGMQHYLRVKDNCHLSGSCHDDCRAAVAEAKEHPCLKGGDIADFVVNILHGSKEGLEYLRLLNMCPTNNVVTCPTPSAGAQMTFSSVLLLLILMVF
ncbi:DBH-like monooxygenase protein 1 [Haliotis asinina]|uniref:DBH-like monooxygenase protein 1 n=1 Tax=Haliotis asinina TaxID=109174 RepID=UPI0035317F6B